MASLPRLKYIITNQMELNFSYMPFIKDGGIFFPTNDTFNLGDHIILDLQLPGHPTLKEVTGKIVWITPPNSLYLVYPGIGIQFIGDTAKTIHDIVKSSIDNTMDVGSYTLGLGNTSEK